MANWSLMQQTRLAGEMNLIAREIPGFEIYDRTRADITTVRGNYISTANRTYTLCVWLTASYPDAVPNLYLISPCPLYGHGGKTIQSYGTSHTMHSWSSDWNNYAKICHTKLEFWSAADTIIGVIMKGFLWVEAFEVHCKTGQSIDTLSRSY